MSCEGRLRSLNSEVPISHTAISQGEINPYDGQEVSIQRSSQGSANTTRKSSGTVAAKLIACP